MSKIVSKINALIEKFGVDKALHFTLGGWIVAIFSPLGVIATSLAYVFLLLISIAKEKWMDEYEDKKDIVAAMIGGTISYIISLLFVFV